MLQTAPHPESASTTRLTAFTIEGALHASGHAVRHVQYVTKEYVVTELGRSVILHSVALGGRFVVDAIEKRLRPIELAAQRVQSDHLRELIGNVSVHRDPEIVDVGGFECRRYRLCNDSSRITISAEAFCTRVEGIDRTALHLERELEAQLHPFALPLGPAEVVVQSITRTFSNGYQHVQEYRISTIVPEIRHRGALEQLLSYAVIEE